MADQLDAALGSPLVPRAASVRAPLRDTARAGAAALAGWLEREAFLIVLLSIYVVGVTRSAPGQVASDTWMTFAYGREIVLHGLPTHDTLTVWAHGRDWVDQQWLGQLGLYGLYAVGGIRAALGVNAVALAGAAVLAVVAARRHGGSARSVTWLALATLVVVAWSSWTLRVQALVYPLFVALLWLLAADSRRPSRRVFLAIPILVVWANLHGTAFLGAALVALRGASMLIERERPWRRRVPPAVALIASPVLLLASPYGLSLVGYYRDLLLNPAFSRYVTEWAPTKLGLGTAPFYLVALLAAWLAGRCASRLTRFEQAALFVTLVLAWLAIRSVVWFMLAALILLPVALDGVLDGARWSSARFRLLNRLMGALAPVACGVVAVAALAQPGSRYTKAFPHVAADRVAAIAARDDNARVFANERFADWLVLEHPRLAGRIAFDGRFELLTARELRRIVAFRVRVTGFAATTRGYELLVLDAQTERDVVRTLLATDSRRRVVYRSATVVVIRQPGGRPRRGMRMLSDSSKDQAALVGRLFQPPRPTVTLHGSVGKSYEEVGPG